MTPALVTKESGPPESVKNLQGDDEHDFMLMDDRNHVVLQSKLPPLKKVTFIVTFHHEGLFPFFCTVHQPEMSGQVMVLPALR